MRENIGLYRGKRKDNGEWIEGAYSPYNWNFFGEREEKPQIIIISDDENIDGLWCEVLPETVGECTGLKDKNGKRIFEGDIVSLTKWNGLIYKVVYDNYRYELYNSNETCCYVFSIYKSKDIEVIGNIYDNPELLGNASKPDAENIAQDVMRPATPEGADNFELMPG